MGEPRLLQALAASPADDPVLRRFRKALDETYGDRIERVVLYGSRARGEARPESDYDVAVFLYEMTDRYDQLDRLADMGTNILEREGKLVHAVPFHSGTYSARIPIMHEIRKDGIDL